MNIVKQESGRSMVEMLGVLAIIGVLSVGGIAAYTTAMNQHRANELQQELTLRATSIAGQLIHEGTGSLSEFPQEVSGHTITYVPVAGENKFTLSATNVSESVCQKLKQAIGDNSIIRTIEPETCVDNGTMVFTFNNDLSPEDTEIEKEILPDPCLANNSCSDSCQKCEDGLCINKCSDGEICTQGTTTTDYKCIPTNTLEGCESCNSKTQYCQINTASSQCVADVLSGTCVDLESKQDFENTKVTITFSDGHTLDVYVAPTTMNWWTGKNWCNAHGREMVSFNDICGSESGCPEMAALRQAVPGKKGIYTRRGVDACNVYGVSTQYGAVQNAIYRYNKLTVLCK